MAQLPDGVVTFLFTDVEGSTRIWEEAPDSMMQALEQHDEAIDEAAAAYNGISVKPRGEGDSRFVVFRSALDAVAAAADMQRRLAAVDWATPEPLRVRASLHTGTADLRGVTTTDPRSTGPRGSERSLTAGRRSSRVRRGSWSAIGCLRG